MLPSLQAHQLPCGWKEKPVLTIEKANLIAFARLYFIPLKSSRGLFEGMAVMLSTMAFDVTPEELVVPLMYGRLMKRSALSRSLACWQMLQMSRRGVLIKKTRKRSSGLRKRYTLNVPLRRIYEGEFT